MLHLNIIKVKTPEEMGKAAADEFEAVICRKPACVMGLATGSTPLPLYRELIAREQAGKLDFSRVRSANLDEYKGLAPDHPQSYRRFMQENLFDHISIKPENTIVPDGLADDIPSMCRAFERKIEDWGGVDIQLLGIGHDGHIGFNEPCDHFPVMTHEVQLTDMTREANKRFFSSIDEVPTAAVTMGIGTVMAARKIIMVITGADKADILYKVDRKSVVYAGVGIGVRHGRGHSLHRQKCVRRKSQEVYVYHCISNNRIKKGVCPGAFIFEKELLDALADMIQEQLDTTLGQYSLGLENLSKEAEEQKNIQAKIASRKQEIQQLRTYQRGLYEGLIQNHLSKDEYFTFKEKYEAKIEAISGEIEQLKAGLAIIAKQLEQYKMLSQDAQHIKEDRQLTAALIDRLIDRVEVSREKRITVRFRFQSEFEHCEEVLSQCRNM